MSDEMVIHVPSRGICVGISKLAISDYSAFSFLKRRHVDDQNPCV